MASGRVKERLRGMASGEQRRERASASERANQAAGEGKERGQRGASVSRDMRTE
jgi:hypothetical protein